jgi:ribosomal-protein-alanine N-acetyltransferase
MRSRIDWPPAFDLDEHVLRRFKAADAAAWYGYLVDPRVTEHTSWAPITRELIDALVDKVIVDYAEPRSLRWALARRADDELVGSCGFTRWEPATREAELAYDLAPEHWGRGLMTSAVRAVVAWALGAGSLARVEAFVMTTNLPSIAVLDRACFTRELLLPGYRLVRGVPRDFFRYAIVARETDARERGQAPRASHT